jgi:UDP-2-acetamido-2,6-beta-L-arabino-hexul-4-ose reductase
VIVRIVITGSRGFLGANLLVRLRKLEALDVHVVTHQQSRAELKHALSRADFVFHLAGVNRPTDEQEFTSGNAEFTRLICAALKECKRAAPIAFASSTQADLSNEYGRSKLAAERVLVNYSAETGAKVYIFRLPNVFGKWALPNYNSVVATFCHNMARGLPITIHEHQAKLRLVYIDDVVDAFVKTMHERHLDEYCTVGPVYDVTVGELAELLQNIASGRKSPTLPSVQSGLCRALYSTYLTYLPVEEFSYALKRHSDHRGTFVEFLKSTGCGQISYFTANPGITRGGHYHHSKTEKFLVVQGIARFRFRHIVTGKRVEVISNSCESRVIDVVPGWTHDVTNIGSEELVVLVWANEIFDPHRPDTEAEKVDN